MKGRATPPRSSSANSWTNSKLVASLSVGSLCQPSEVSKAINARAVSIRPTRLQRVTAHQLEAHKLKTLVGVSHMWPRDIAEHIRFAAARRARTRATQHFEFEKRFGAVVPRNRELVSDLLDVCWLQAHFDNYFATDLHR